MDELSLRDLARWPGVEASTKWEDDFVLSVGGKMFCVMGVRGPHAGRMSFKVEDGRFLELSGRPGFVPAPYLARAHWVQVLAPDTLGAGEVRGLVRRSYELVRAKLSKKAQRDLAD